MTEVVLLVGGRSTEHDASVHSYRSLRAALRSSRRVRVQATVYVDRCGAAVLHQGAPTPEHLIGAAGDALAPAELIGFLGLPTHVFSLLHGTEGEDGGWQGVADVFDLPGNFGPVAAASLSMNKFACAATVAALEPDLAIPETVVVSTTHPASGIEAACRGLEGRACVVKPNSLGASLLTDYLAGPDPAALTSLVRRIGRYDRQVLIQEYVAGDEVTVGVFDHPDGLVVLPPARARVPGHILGHHEKHASGAGVRVDWPDPHGELGRFLVDVSARLFRALDLRLWGRFDFLVRHEPQGVYFLEVNSMPGLGQGSIYPVMLERTGRTLEDLVVASIGLSSIATPVGKLLEYTIESHEIARA